MITQTINLNLIPGAVPPRVNVTQYDEGSRTIVANLYNGTSSFAPSAGTTAKVKGTKPDKHGFEYDATISGRTVEIDLTQQMSCVAGDVPCEVELTLGDEVLGTGTFVLRVKASALADDTDISETEIPAIVDAAQSSAASAAASAEAAQEAANSVSVEYTTSGNPISVSAFPTEATTSMTISPTQNLHGYDKPWAAGAGKNKALFNYTSGEESGVHITNNNDGTFSVYTDAGGATANVTFVLHNFVNNGNVLDASLVGKSVILSGCPSGGSESSYYMQFFRYDGTNTARDTGNGTSALSVESVTTGYVNIAIRVVSGTVITTPIIFKPMVRLSSESDATFAPYSNICPITGITTATVQTTDGETTNTASIQIGQTVYGGTINFNTGVLTIDRAYVKAKDLTWFTQPSAYARFATVSLNDVIKKSDTDYVCISDIYESRSNQDALMNYNQIYVNASGYIKVGDEEYASSTVEQWLAARGETEIVYKLATPTTLSLTPDTLTMLDGDQTVSGNGETVTISYDGNVKQYIDTKVPDAPTTDGTYTLTCVVSGGVPTYSWT